MAIPGRKLPARLPLLCRPVDDETLSGFLLRLMERNGLDGLEEAGTLRDARLPLFRWQPEQLEDLAALSGMPVPALLAINPGMAPLDRDPSRHGLDTADLVVVGGHAIDPTRLVYLPRRFCPGCLAVSRHHRLEWDVRAIQHCHRHRQALRWACPSCSEEQSWRRGLLATCGCGFDLATAKPVPIPEPALPLVEILDSLFRGVPVAVPLALVGLGFARAVDVLDEAGALATGGPSAIAPNARHPETTEWLSEGLASLEAGDARFTLLANLRCLRFFDSGSELSEAGLDWPARPATRARFSGRQAATVFARALRLEAIGTPGTRALAAAIRAGIGVEPVAPSAAPRRSSRPRSPSPGGPYQHELRLEAGKEARTGLAAAAGADADGGLPERERYAARAGAEILKARGGWKGAGALLEAAGRATSAEQLDEIVAPSRPPPKPGFIRFVAERPILDVLELGRRLWDTHIGTADDTAGRLRARAELDELTAAGARSVVEREASAIRMLGPAFILPPGSFLAHVDLELAEDSLDDVAIETYEATFRRSATVVGVGVEEAESLLSTAVRGEISGRAPDELVLFFKVAAAPGNTEEETSLLLRVLRPGIESVTPSVAAGPGLVGPLEGGTG